MTHDGQHVVLSNSGGHLEHENSSSHLDDANSASHAHNLQENNSMPDTSDLSSLAAAAEAHEGMVS